MEAVEKIKSLIYLLFIYMVFFIHNAVYLFLVDYGDYFGHQNECPSPENLLWMEALRISADFSLMIVLFLSISKNIRVSYL